MDVSDHKTTRKTTRSGLIQACFAVCFALFFFYTVPAQAYMGKDKIPPLSFTTKTTEQEFRQKSDEYNITPLEDKSLNFKVRLPQGWTPLDSDLTKGTVGGDIFHLLAMYTSPPNFAGRSQFRVRSLELPSLISAENWMIAYMLEMGFSLEGIHVDTRKKVEAQYTVFIDNTPYVTRAVIELSGTRAVIAEYLVPQDKYEEEKEDQILAMKTYDLLSPSDAPAVEMKSYAFVDIARFDYPNTWSLIAPVITNIENMNATLISITDKEVSADKVAKIGAPQLNGRIDISIIARRDDVTLKDQVDFMKKEMDERKVKIASHIETINDIEFNSLKGNVRVDVYSLEGTEEKLVDHEYWGAILQTPGHYYLVRLITIGRLQNFKTWAQNVETFRYVIGSLAPNHDTLD